MRIPCFIDINSLVPVKYIINEHRWGKDAVIATYSQYGKGGVFPNGQIQRPWRIPSRTWWEVQDINNIQGRKHHESLSLKRCIINFNVRATTGITVEQWRSGLCGRVRAACRKEKYNWQWLQSWQEKKCFMDVYRCIIKWLSGSAKKSILFLSTVVDVNQQYDYLDVWELCAALSLCYMIWIMHPTKHYWQQHREGEAWGILFVIQSCGIQELV